MYGQHRIRVGKRRNWVKKKIGVLQQKIMKGQHLQVIPYEVYQVQMSFYADL